jgi:GTP cyclohydrolase I
MVVVSGMTIWSMCEHHLLPFRCNISIGYISAEKILGLSKFARIAQQYAHRLQIQERMVEQIADEVTRLTASPDVAVVASGEHLCMLMRGIKTSAIMTSSAMRGAFRDNATTRAEFLEIARYSYVK